VLLAKFIEVELLLVVGKVQGFQLVGGLRVDLLETGHLGNELVVLGLEFTDLFIFSIDLDHTFAHACIFAFDLLFQVNYKLLMVSDLLPQSGNDFLILLFALGQNTPIVILFLFHFFLEFGLELEDNLVPFLFAFEVPGCVFGDFLAVVFLFVFFCACLVLEGSFEGL
jgi:hypothetical protein